jgi:hypothetical protein
VTKEKDGKKVTDVVTDTVKVQPDADGNIKATETKKEEVTAEKGGKGEKVEKTTVEKSTVPTNVPAPVTTPVPPPAAA